MRNMITLLLVFISIIKSFCQTEIEDEYFMGKSVKSDSTFSINNIQLTTNESVKAFYNYNGIKLRDDIKYGRYGIDISKWNGEIDWNKIKTDTLPDKLFFVISKATQGINFVDKNFNNNFNEAKKNGFLVGAYHFYNQKDDPIKQANNFIRNVNLLKGDILPILDIEKNCFKNCENTPDIILNYPDLIKNLKLYISTIENYYKAKVIIYTNEAFYNDYLSVDFKDSYFWIAKYGNTPPKCFQVGEVFSFDNPCFKNSKKGCWQYTQWGKIKGINTFVDINFINNYYLLKWKIN